MSSELEIIARQDVPAEITANVEGKAEIAAAVEAPAEIHAEVEAAGPPGPQGPQGIQGIPGNDGTDGQDGADGVSPVIYSEEITGGHRVTITDADHPLGQTFDVMDGTDGTDGTDGADGVSPEVTITNITGGHSVTITDADHPGGQTFNVMDGVNGAPGQDGQGVPPSGSTGQVLAKKSGTDYDTEWVTPSAGSNDVEWVTYGSTTSATIETAYQAGKIVAVLSGDRVHYLQKRNSSTDHLFYAAIDTRFYVCRCTNNSWSNYYYECLELGDTGTIPSGGNAGQLLAKNSATDYDVHWVNKTQDYPSAYCTTAAGTAAKKASCSLWVDTANSYLHVLIGQANTNAGAITLNVNSTGAKPIYINGEASSATNYTLPAGSYIVFYDGTNFYFRTDGKLTADITGTADGILHVGPSAPTDPDVSIWLDTDEPGQTVVTSVNGASGAVTIPLATEGNDYIQFPSGTMMCWGVTDWTLVSANSYSDVSVVFPASFIDDPVVVAGMGSDSSAAEIGYISVATFSRSSSGATFRIFSKASAGRSPRVFWQAVGKWK